jgi:hypothetical protein
MTKNNKGRDRWHGATPKSTDSRIILQRCAGGKEGGDER